VASKKFPELLRKDEAEHFATQPAAGRVDRLSGTGSYTTAHRIVELPVGKIADQPDRSASLLQAAGVGGLADRGRRCAQLEVPEEAVVGERVYDAGKRGAIECNVVIGEADGWRPAQILDAKRIVAAYAVADIQFHGCAICFDAGLAVASEYRAVDHDLGATAGRKAESGVLDAHVVERSVNSASPDNDNAGLAGIPDSGVGNIQVLPSCSLVTQMLPPTSGESTFGTSLLMQSDWSLRMRYTCRWFGSASWRAISASAEILLAMAATTTTQSASRRIHPRIRVVGRIISSLAAAKDFIHLKIASWKILNLRFSPPLFTPTLAQVRCAR
jgi:hypothetical protein